MICITMINFHHIDFTVYGQTSPTKMEETISNSLTSSDYGGMYYIGETLHIKPLPTSENKIKELVSKWNKKYLNTDEPCFIVVDSVAQYSYKELKDGLYNLQQHVQELGISSSNIDIRHNSLVVRVPQWTETLDEKIKTITGITNIIWEIESIPYNTASILLTAQSNEIQRYENSKHDLVSIDSVFGDGISYVENDVFMIPIRDFILAYDKEAIITWDEQFQQAIFIFKDLYHQKREIRVGMMEINQEKRLSIHGSNIQLLLNDGFEIKDGRYYFSSQVLRMILDDQYLDFQYFEDTKQLLIENAIKYRIVN